jgi:hypothetical protein
MNKKPLLLLTIALGLASGPAAFATPRLLALAETATIQPVLNIEADCYAIGQDKAAEMGGTLAKAAPAMDGDTPVCRLVIVVPGNDGERPKRVEVIVPQ